MFEKKLREAQREAEQEEEEIRKRQEEMRRTLVQVGCVDCCGDSGLVGNHVQGIDKAVNISI